MKVMLANKIFTLLVDTEHLFRDFYKYLSLFMLHSLVSGCYMLHQLATNFLVCGTDC